MVQFIQSHNILQLSEMQFQSSLKAQQNHFDLKCMMMMMNDIVEIQTSHITLNETTLGMVDSLGPKLQDLFWRNLWKSSSIQERRGLWLTVLELQAILDCQVLHLTQQVLEMIKSMVIIFLQASFQYCRLSMDHVSWTNVCQIREKGLLHHTWLL